MTLRILTVILALFVSIGVQADLHSDALEKIVSATWKTNMDQNPTYDIYFGVKGYEHLLPPMGLNDHQRFADRYRKLLKDLAKIDETQLTGETRITYDVLKFDLRANILEFEAGAHMTPVDRLGGYHLSLLQLPDKTTFKTVKDYENFISRLGGIKKFTDQHIEVLRRGIRTGNTLPKKLLTGYLDSFTPHVSAKPQDTVFYKPFLAFSDSISAKDQARLRAAAQAVIAKKIQPQFKRFRDFMEREYIPQARTTIGYSAIPNGLDAYNKMIEVSTTLPLTAKEIHETGLSEVKRIQGEMRGILKQAGFNGTVKEFTAQLRADPQYVPASAQALLEKTNSIVGKMREKLPLLFGKLPKAALAVEPTPDFLEVSAPTAYYTYIGNSEDPAQGRGIYYVNTYNLKSRPLYETEALSLHEGIPGHHLQIAIQRELSNQSDYRRNYGATSFAEGWGLYAEGLGLEVGFYKDLAGNFGRLSYEMWRACRLVVDTGMHAFGWTREQAIQYLMDNTAMTLHNSTAEVDRYIGWPAQALAYKTGELKIRSLRAEAQRALGEKFDIREFHDQVLGSGSIPLAVLEQKIRRYISEKVAGQL
jgi:uncharacterized protein (DUF885 family)